MEVSRSSCRAKSQRSSFNSNTTFTVFYLRRLNLFLDGTVGKGAQVHKILNENPLSAGESDVYSTLCE